MPVKADGTSHLHPAEMFPNEKAETEYHDDLLDWRAPLLDCDDCRPFYDSLARESILRARSTEQEIRPSCGGRSWDWIRKPSLADRLPENGGAFVGPPDLLHSANVSRIEDMPRLEVLVLCDAILRDPRGKFELRGLFDRVIIENLPTFHREMFLFFRFYGDPDSLNPSPVMRCKIVLPDGQEEGLPDLSPKIDHLGKVEGFLRLQGFPLTQYGEHQVHLYLDDQHIGYYRFECVNVNSLQGVPPNARIN